MSHPSGRHESDRLARVKSPLRDRLDSRALVDLRTAIAAPHLRIHADGSRIRLHSAQIGRRRAGRVGDLAVHAVRLRHADERELLERERFLLGAQVHPRRALRRDRHAVPQVQNHVLRDVAVELFVQLVRDELPAQVQVVVRRFLELIPDQRRLLQPRVSVLELANRSMLLPNGRTPARGRQNKNHQSKVENSHL